MLGYQDFQQADEIFATGNYSKVVPVTRIDDRSLPFGPCILRRGNYIGSSRIHNHRTLRIIIQRVSGSNSESRSSHQNPAVSTRSGVA